MATAKVNKLITITLGLSEDEARFLKDSLQNYAGENPSDEPPKDKKIRESTFLSLKQALDELKPQVLTR